MANQFGICTGSGFTRPRPIFSCAVGPLKFALRLSRALGLALIATSAVGQPGSADNSVASTESVAGAITLENTYWKLTTLRGKAIEVADKKREPYLILQAARQQLMGSSGCNRLQGGYTLQGEQLTFARAGTLMACKQGMEQERDFLDALTAVTHWRIAAQRLELLDASDQVVAIFEPRYL